MFLDGQPGCRLTLWRGREFQHAPEFKRDSAMASRFFSLPPRLLCLFILPGAPVRIEITGLVKPATGNTLLSDVLNERRGVVKNRSLEPARKPRNPDILHALHPVPVF